IELPRSTTPVSSGIPARSTSQNSSNRRGSPPNTRRTTFRRFSSSESPPCSSVSAMPFGATIRVPPAHIRMAFRHGPDRDLGGIRKTTVTAVSPKPSLVLSSQSMPFIITDPCIYTKDTACVDVCPVDCIHPRKDEPEFESALMLYIHPEECID